MTQPINTLCKGLPKSLEEPPQLGRPLRRRRVAPVAYFDIGVSNGPVEVADGPLAQLRSIASGFSESNPIHLEVTDPPRTDAGRLLRTVNPEEHL